MLSGDVTVLCLLSYNAKFYFQTISTQNFVTDLAATSGRVKTISSEAERMVRAGHSQAREIQARQQQLKQR